jgi:hypothetical protein
MGFLFARREHLNRCFVSVNHALGKYRFTQRIDQRLELHTGLAVTCRSPISCTESDHALKIQSD